MIVRDIPVWSLIGIPTISLLVISGIPTISYTVIPTKPIIIRIPTQTHVLQVLPSDPFKRGPQGTPWSVAVDPAPTRTSPPTVPPQNRGLNERLAAN